MRTLIILGVFIISIASFAQPAKNSDVYHPFKEGDGAEVYPCESDQKTADLRIKGTDGKDCIVPMGGALHVITRTYKPGPNRPTDGEDTYTFEYRGSKGICRFQVTGSNSPLLQFQLGGNSCAGDHVDTPAPKSENRAIGTTSPGPALDVQGTIIDEHNKN